MESTLFNYEKSMQQHMETLFQSLDAEDEVFQNISEEFTSLMEVRQDPPFEVIWIYSSPICKGSLMEGKDFEGRIALMKSIFTGICERTASSGVSKSIAMLAPMCLWISGLFVYVYSSDFDSATQDVMMREISSFVDLMLSHVSVCCSGSNDDDRSHRLCKPLEDLLALWMENKKDCTALLTCTFSSLSDEIRLRLSRASVEVSELSGAVAAQLFLMRMGMSLQILGEKAKMSDLEEVIKRWGVITLTGLRNLDLFVMLLQTLLEGEPFTGTLGSDIGASLRAALYEVVLVDYAFLDPESGDQHSSVHLKNIALLRLLVASEAVEFFREEGHHSKAISCENAFSTSRLSTQLSKLVPSGLNKCKRNGSSPKAFLKWFLELEQQGVKVFSDSTTKYSNKLSLELSKRRRDLPVQDQSESEDSDADDDNIMFSIDKAGEIETEGDEEELDKMNNAFITAANTMNTAAVAEPNKAKKRKTGSSVKGKKKLKRSVVVADNDLSDSSGEESLDKAVTKSSDDADTDKSED